MTSTSTVTETPQRSRWLVVALLTLAIVIAYTDRINLSAALPAIRASFPISPEAAGLLLSAFFWSYTLLQTPAGWAVEPRLQRGHVVHRPAGHGTFAAWQRRAAFFQ